jgi:hypothetical protein
MMVVLVLVERWPLVLGVVGWVVPYGFAAPWLFWL